MLSQLSVEVLDLIICHLNSTNLPPVCLSAKFMNSVAIRRLYESIQLCKPMISYQCLRTLATSPELASFVRKIKLEWATIRGLTRNFYLLALRAFQQMEHLESLALDMPPDDGALWTLSCASFRLEAFSTSCYCDEALAVFLDAQPSIKKLTLRGLDKSIPISIGNILEDDDAISSDNPPGPTSFTTALKPSSLPDLSELRVIHAGPSILSSLITGRSLARITTPIFSGCTSEVLSVLHKSSNTLRVLNLISYDSEDPISVLAEVVECFPSLSGLHLTFCATDFSEVCYMLSVRP
jgi:hypothetical protein